MHLPTVRHRKVKTGMPERVDARPGHARLRRIAAAVGIGALALSFVGGALALVVELLPAKRLLGNTGVDLGVALLFVPLCALVFVLLAEAVRAVFSDSVLRSARDKPLHLGIWQPGRGKG